MDRLVAMRVFVETVERGTVSAAAESLDMSRAMASRYLESLEAWLGSRLLHRTTRRLGLTDAGEQALSRCREILDLADDVRSAASQQGSVRGKLRVTTSSSFAQTQLAAALVDFQSQHPAVEIELLVIDRAVNLAEERVDLAVRISNHVDDTLVVRPLALCHSVLCAAPAYLKAAGAPLLPHELQAHRCVVHSTGFATEVVLQRGDEHWTVPLRSFIRTNETSVMRAAVVAGAGIAMLPTYYIGADLRDGTLVRVLPDYALSALKVQAVYLSRRHQPRALRLLIDFLAQRFEGSTAPWD